ncbi:hypothetical protein WUBG_01387, partial [Wuchereria bancrofti]
MGRGFVITGQCSGQQTRGAVRRRMLARVVLGLVGGGRVCELSCCSRYGSTLRESRHMITCMKSVLRVCYVVVTRNKNDAPHFACVLASACDASSLMMMMMVVVVVFYILHEGCKGKEGKGRRLDESLGFGSTKYVLNFGQAVVRGGEGEGEFCLLFAKVSDDHRRCDVAVRRWPRRSLAPSTVGGTSSSPAMKPCVSLGDGTKLRERKRHKMNALEVLSFDLILTIAGDLCLQLSLVNMLVCDLPVAPNMCGTNCATHIGPRESHTLTDSIFPPLLTSLHYDAVTRCHMPHSSDSSLPQCL